MRHSECKCLKFYLTHWLDGQKERCSELLSRHLFHNKKTHLKFHCWKLKWNVTTPQVFSHSHVTKLFISSISLNDFQTFGVVECNLTYNLLSNTCNKALLFHSTFTTLPAIFLMLIFIASSCITLVSKPAPWLNFYNRSYCTLDSDFKVTGQTWILNHPWI